MIEVILEDSPETTRIQRQTVRQHSHKGYLKGQEVRKCPKQVWKDMCSMRRTGLKIQSVCCKLQIITIAREIPCLTCCLSYYHFSTSGHMGLAVSAWQPVEWNSEARVSATPTDQKV